MGFDVGAGLAQAGETVGKLTGEAALKAQQNAAEQDKIRLMDELTTVRESKGRQEEHGLKMEQQKDTQTYQSGENEKNRTSEEKRTNITAGASVEGHRISAGASKYHADVLERIEKMKSQTSKDIVKMQTESREGIASENRKVVELKLGATMLPPDAVDNLADQFIETGKTPSVGARNTQAQVQIQTRVAEKLKEQGKKIEDIRPGWATVEAARKDLDYQTKMGSQITNFANTMHKNIEALTDLWDGLGPTAVPVIDRWVQAGRRAIGDPDVDALDFQLRAIATEAAKLTTNQLGIAGLPEGARTEYGQIMNNFKNKETIERVIQTIQADGFNRLSSQQQQIEAAKQAIKTREAVPFQERSEGVRATPNNPKGVPLDLPMVNGVPDKSKMTVGKDYTVDGNPYTWDGNNLILKKKK